MNAVQCSPASDRLGGSRRPRAEKAVCFIRASRGMGAQGIPCTTPAYPNVLQDRLTVWFSRMNWYHWAEDISTVWLWLIVMLTRTRQEILLAIARAQSQGKFTRKTLFEACKNDIAFQSHWIYKIVFLQSQCPALSLCKDPTR